MQTWQWRINGLVALLRSVVESRVSNQLLGCTAVGGEGMTVCMLQGSCFV